MDELKGMMGRYHILLVSAAGLEPATNGLKGHCSAIELRARALCILSRKGSLVNVTAAIDPCTPARCKP